MTKAKPAFRQTLADYIQDLEGQIKEHQAQIKHLQHVLDDANIMAARLDTPGTARKGRPRVVPQKAPATTGEYSGQMQYHPIPDDQEVTP